MVTDPRPSAPLWLALFLLLLLCAGLALAAGAPASSAAASLASPTGATSTPTAFPTCGPGSDYIIIPSTGTAIAPSSTLISGSQCDDCVVTITLPFTFSFYGQPFTSARLSSNGNVQFAGATSNLLNTCLPAPTLNYAMLPHWDDLDLRTTISATSGIFTSLLGSTPNRTLNIEWRGCLFQSPNSCGGNVNFEVKLYETPLPDGTQFDFVYGGIASGGSGATVGAQRATGVSYTQYSCDTANLSNGLRLSFRPYACGESTFTPTVTTTPTDTPTDTPTSTPTSTPDTCGPFSNYTVSPSTGSISPGVNLVVGSQCDDCVAGIALPFPFALYGQTYVTVTASTNGNLQFTSADPEPANVCLPDTQLGATIFPHFDDLNMVSSLTTTLGTPGIYVVTTGSTPNRVYHIEYRACLYAGPGACGGNVNFEVRLFENSGVFQVIYGETANNGAGATVGVQNDDATLSSQYACNTPNGVQPGLLLSFSQPPCGSVTPTGTPIPSTNTPTNLATGTGTTTSTRTRTLTPTPSSPTSTRTNTPVRTETAVLVGHVTWQGRPAQPNTFQQVPITLTLKIGSLEANYPAQTTDASGYFTVSVASLPPGTYNWRVKSLRYLANSGQVVIGLKIAGYKSKIGGPQSSILNLQSVIPVEMGLMKAGDADNNNAVNVNDFNIIRNSFGKSLGEPGYDTRGDFDGNNTINILDFNLLKLNFGQSGAPPI
jgi:hypothetical protein